MNGVNSPQSEVEENGEHVVMIVDCSMHSWSKVGELAEQEVPPGRRCNVTLAIESCYVLESAIRLFHADNRTTIIAATGSPKKLPTVSDLINEVTNDPVSIVKALTIGLCIINRDAKERSSSTTETRIVLITATPISAYDFVTCMNCAFAAQKLGIVIDVFDYSQSTTPELLQLVHHTNGWYLALSPKDGQQGVLAHALLSNFSASASARKYITPPSCPATDTKTICFCHQKNLISLGYVCSVCLHVFCERKNICRACNSRVLLKKKT